VSVSYDFLEYEVTILIGNSSSETAFYMEEQVRLEIQWPS